MAVKARSGVLERLTPILLILSVILAFFVGVLWNKVSNLEKNSNAQGVDLGTPANDQAAQPQPQPPSGELTEEQVKAVPEVSADDKVRGPRNAKVALIEYSDLECPFCKKFHPDVKRLMDEYEGQIVWVYRHFPLDMLHSQARTESQATECAFEQGGQDGFWKMVDKIYEVTPANNGLNLDDLPKLATEVGLNGTTLQECIDSEKFADRVDSDYQGGVKAGVTGTPGSFIITSDGKGWAIPGAVGYTSLKQAIDEALKS